MSFTIIVTSGSKLDTFKIVLQRGNRNFLLLSKDASVLILTEHEAHFIILIGHLQGLVDRRLGQRPGAPSLVTVNQDRHRHF